MQDTNKLDLKENIKKVRVSEEEHKIMIRVLYDDIKTLRMHQEDTKKPEKKDYYRKEEFKVIILLRKMLPEGSGGVMNKAKLIIGKQKIDQEYDGPMQEAIDKETNDRMGQAGCRGEDCD